MDSNGGIHQKGYNVYIFLSNHLYNFLYVWVCVCVRVSVCMCAHTPKKTSAPPNWTYQNVGNTSVGLMVFQNMSRREQNLNADFHAQNFHYHSLNRLQHAPQPCPMCAGNDIPDTTQKTVTCSLFIFTQPVKKKCTQTSLYLHVNGGCPKIAISLRYAYKE